MELDTNLAYSQHVITVTHPDGAADGMTLEVMKTPHKMVEEFMNKFGFLDEPYTQERLDQREVLLDEEYTEYKVARAAGDKVGMIDAICDMVYVLVGDALAYGWHFDSHFAYVHAANMNKLRGEKSTRPGSGGFDVIKPEGWIGPERAHADLFMDGQE